MKLPIRQVKKPPLKWSKRLSQMPMELLRQTRETLLQLRLIRTLRQLLTAPQAETLLIKVSRLRLMALSKPTLIQALVIRQLLQILAQAMVEPLIQTVIQVVIQTQGIQLNQLLMDRVQMGIRSHPLMKLMMQEQQTLLHLQPMMVLLPLEEIRAQQKGRLPQQMQLPIIKVPLIQLGPLPPTTKLQLLIILLQLQLPQTPIQIMALLPDCFKLQ